MPAPARKSRLLTIGGFARMARLSVKALRHYDAEGLLLPAWIDPSSGYRYYIIEQVPVATTIALLRSLDVPLPRIRAVLGAPDDVARAALLADESSRLAAEVERHRRALVTLQRLSAQPAGAAYDVALGSRRGQRLWAVRATVRADRIDVDMGVACGRLAALVAAGVVGSGPFVAVFPLDLDEVLEIAVGLPAGPGAAPTALEPLDVPVGAWASTLHVGAYAALPLAYTALLNRVGELGHQAVGPVCET